MATIAPIRKKIQMLKKEFSRLSQGKASLLIMIDEAEIPESVYNSNAIENSTLTLKETEKILLEMEVSRNVSLKEVFEAKNLARVMEYMRNNIGQRELDQAFILLLHKMLISNINDEIAGRFRQKGEYVRVGPHIAPAPEHVEGMIEDILVAYSGDLESFAVDAIARFHLDFEHIHPFIDGNGRLGRVLMNFQLFKKGFPAVIIRNKEKQRYYQALRDYDTQRKNTKGMEKIVTLALIESLHKRITYLKGEKIITLADYGRKHKKNIPALLNAAARQNIPAFREKGVWKIGADFKASAQS